MHSGPLPNSPFRIPSPSQFPRFTRRSVGTVEQNWRDPTSMKWCRQLLQQGRSTSGGGGKARVPSSRIVLKIQNLKNIGELLFPLLKTLFVSFLKNKPFLKVLHFFHVLPGFPPPPPLRSSTPLFPTGLQASWSSVPFSKNVGPL